MSKFNLANEMDECAGELEAHHSALINLTAGDPSFDDLRFHSVNYGLGYLLARMRAAVERAGKGDAS